MLQYGKSSFPPDFDRFFKLINSKHLHETPLASTLNYSLPLVRTNCRMFKKRKSMRLIDRRCNDSYIVSFCRTTRGCMLVL